VEDEQGDFVSRLNESIDIAHRISRYRGLVNLLIHTETTGEKLGFIEKFVNEFRNMAWFGTLGEFGRWWETRAGTRMEVQRGVDGTVIIQLDAPSPIEGLTLELPSGWAYETGPAGTFQKGELLSLGAFSGEIQVSLKED